MVEQGVLKIGNSFKLKKQKLSEKYFRGENHHTLSLHKTVGKKEF